MLVEDHSWDRGGACTPGTWEPQSDILKCTNVEWSLGSLSPAKSIWNHASVGVGELESRKQSSQGWDDQGLDSWVLGKGQDGISVYPGWGIGTKLQVPVRDLA